MREERKCRCGTPLHPQYTQEERPGQIVVTPIPDQVNPYTLPLGDLFDPLAWGATPEDVWTWQDHGGRPEHDISDRRGLRQATGSCTPDVPDPLPHPHTATEILEAELRESAAAAQQVPRGRSLLVPCFAEFWRKALNVAYPSCPPERPDGQL